MEREQDVIDFQFRVGALLGALHNETVIDYLQEIDVPREDVDRLEIALMALSRHVRGERKR